MKKTIFKALSFVLIAAILIGILPIMAEAEPVPTTLDWSGGTWKVAGNAQSGNVSAVEGQLVISDLVVDG